MATQTLEFDYVAGQTLTAKLFPLGSDTQQGTTVSPVEESNRDGLYTAAFTDAPAGDYKLRVYLGGVFAASFPYTLTLTTATFRETSPGGECSSLAAQAKTDVRSALSGLVVRTITNPPEGNTLRVFLGDKYGTASGRPIEITFDIAALSWVVAGDVELHLKTVDDDGTEHVATLDGEAVLTATEIECSFGSLSADWGDLTAGIGEWIVVQMDGTEPQTLAKGKAIIAGTF